MHISCNSSGICAIAETASELSLADHRFNNFEQSNLTSARSACDRSPCCSSHETKRSSSSFRGDTVATWRGLQALHRSNVHSLQCQAPFETIFLALQPSHTMVPV